MNEELSKWTTLQFEIKQALVAVQQQQLAILSDIARQMEDSLRTIATIKQEIMEKK